MSFINERAIKTICKRHVCDACGLWIEIGESSLNWCGLNDGYFYSSYYHPECRAAEIDLNDSREWRPGDDWCNLRFDAERDDYRWLKKDHPVAYRRMLTPRDPRTLDELGYKITSRKGN